jgi:signal transduction histidine kinase
MVEILSNPTEGIQADISVGRTLAQAMQYFSIKVLGSNEEYPIENFPVFSALRGDPAAADDIEAVLGERRVPLEVWASPVRDADGEVVSAVVAMQDITERKRADAELAVYRKSLETLVQSRTEELIAFNMWLTAINRIRQTVSGTNDLQQAYETLSETVLQILEARLVFILCWDDQHEWPETLSCSLQDGWNLDLLDKLKSSFEIDSPLRREIEQGETLQLSIDRATSMSLPIQECFREDGFQVLLLAPMSIQQSIGGVLGVAWPVSVKEIIPMQFTLVEKMALDLADLAQDADLRDQALALAAANERNRLARDLHDSVTQMLFSANLVAEVLPQIWRRDPGQGLNRLEKLQRLTRGALAEMRTMLLELRPSALIDTPLSNLLAQLTEAIASRSGLPFQLFIERIPPLPENVHTAFYRVAQEALNNVVKHAQAKLITVSLIATPLPADLTAGERHEVRLVVRDDGVGFSSDKSRPDRLGISIMRERAAAIHANLSLESQPGYGTQLTMIWCGETEKIP